MNIEERLKNLSQQKKDSQNFILNVFEKIYEEKRRREFLKPFKILATFSVIFSLLLGFFYSVINFSGSTSFETLVYSLNNQIFNSGIVGSLFDGILFFSFLLVPIFSFPFLKLKNAR